MFFDSLVDYTSSKLNYNKRYLRWNLINHPLSKKDKRYWILLILMMIPTIEMALCIQVFKDVYLAIVVFHATIFLVPIIYLFINSKFIDPNHLDNTRYHKLNRNENYDSIINKFNKTTTIKKNGASSGSSKNNSYSKILIGNKQYKSNKSIISGIYDDNDDINGSNDTDYLIKVNYSLDGADDDSIALMSLPKKIFKSLFSLPQFIIGLVLMILGLSFGSLFYYLFAGFIPNVVTKLSLYGMNNYSFDAEYIFYIYFSIINPIIEEWWWRMFLPNTFGSSKLEKIIINLFYSFYHFVVLTVFFNIYICGFATFVVFIGGMLFVYITKYVGPLASILAHCACDIIIVFIISNMSLLWFPYLSYSY